MASLLTGIQQPWFAPLFRWKPKSMVTPRLWEGEHLSLLLRQDAAQMGPPVARRAGGGKARRVARRMRASSLHAHGCAFSEPR